MRPESLKGILKRHESWSPHWIVDTLEVFTLWSFAVAQPLFDLLRKNPGFFIARQSEPSDIILLALGLCLVLPAILGIVEGIIRLLGKTPYRLAHTLILASLAALVLLPIVKRAGRFPGSVHMMIAFLAGLGGSWLYLKARTQKLSLIFLSPAVIIFPLLFVFQAPIYKLIFGKENLGVSPTIRIGHPVPVVMVVFDEFPLVSLLDEKLEINPIRYPHFAELARNATWYRNATAVSEGTLNAVPTIVDGLYPQPALALLPNAKDHPHTLFAMLGRSYQFHVEENDTRLCPKSLCGGDQEGSSLRQQLKGLGGDLGTLYLYRILPEDLIGGLPDISQSWKDFLVQTERAQQQAALNLDDYAGSREWRNRPEQFKRFVDSITPSSGKPVLNYLHTILPHAPWEYLPSGKKYTLSIEIRGTRGINSQGVDPNLWNADKWAVTQAYQRHLLQVRLVDNLLGYLVDHLRNIGLYDQALIVVTADHGCSFRPNDSRRAPTPTNYADILAVPLLIKTPYQKEGRIDDRNVETIDILPTLADILETELPWKVDGQSLVHEPSSPKTWKTFIDQDGHRLTFDDSLKSASQAVIEKIRIFGAGGQPSDLFKIGAYGELVGQRVTELNLISGTIGKFELDHYPYLSSVDLDSSFLLTHVTGRVFRTSDASFRPLHLAVAINGTIGGVTETYLKGNEERFSVVAPDSAFQEGRNEVRIYAISEPEGRLKLAELQRAGSSPNFQWGTPISFGVRGNSRPYQAEGWGAPDGQLTWTDGKRATLVLRVPQPGASLSLKARLIAEVIPGKVDRQRIRILVNRQLAGEWLIRNRNLHEETLLIRDTLLRDPVETVITFELPDAVAPASLGLSSDLRELGLAFFSISLNTEQETRVNDLKIPPSLPPGTTN